MPFVIDDNFLSDLEIKEINKRFYEIPSLFAPFTTHPGEEKLPSITDKYSNRFMYTSYDDQDKRSDELGIEILKKFCVKNKIEYESILRIRRNTSFLCNDRRPSEPHIDNGKSHLVFLYYVNDSDGDTILYKNKYNKEQDNDMIVDTVISPKAGRGILFDGKTYHSFCYPNINDIRSTININIEKNKPK
jgi:hypothetical protein